MFIRFMVIVNKLQALGKTYIKKRERYENNEISTK